ncbi:MAG TPA: DUF3892 domain-containing protein [Verrucomicrobiae bacterium]
MPFVSATADRKKLTVTYVDDKGAITIYTDGTRAWRNNNMGNMDKGAFASRHGSIGDDGTFAIFPDEATGRSAESALLAGPKYSVMSIADAVAKLTPKTENNTAKYIAMLKKMTGLDVTRKISDLKPAEIGSVLDAIKQLEGWNEDTVTTPKKVTAVKKNKDGDIISYQLEGSSTFILKADAVQMAEDGEIYAVVVEPKKGDAYLRAFPDASSGDNFDSIAV